MSINKSEQFLYFQNKARHYANIRHAKPSVDDKLQKQYRNTIDHTSTEKNKKLFQPPLQFYNRHIENQNLINRIINISKSKRTQIGAQGGYSRYHSVQRSFRTKNPFRDSTQKRISLENQEMFNRLDKTKPVIGSNSEWSNSYQRQLSHKRNMSRYLNSEKSKGSLHISTSRFMPQHYKSYLFDGQAQQYEKKGETIAVITKQKLTQLPKILHSGRSNSVLQSDKSQTDLNI